MDGFDGTDSDKQWYGELETIMSRKHFLQRKTLSAEELAFSAEEGIFCIIELSAEN